jgi:hypothetical protein
MQPQFMIAAVMLCIDKLCYCFIYFRKITGLPQLKIIRSILALKIYTDLQNVIDYGGCTYLVLEFCL